MSVPIIYFDKTQAIIPAAGWTYTDDGNGRRVMKSDGAGHGTMYWYGPSGEVLAETDLSGNITSEYVYFNGARIARRDPATGNIYYYLNDRLGSAKMIVATTSSGTITGVAAESDYYPYGGERVVTADTSGNNYKFTGHERDSETGLDHTDNRQYASTTGRWLAPDPIRGKPADPQSWNRYSYVGGNPVNRLDPNGADWYDAALSEIYNWVYFPGACRVEWDPILGGYPDAPGNCSLIIWEPVPVAPDPKVNYSVGPNGGWFRTSADIANNLVGGNLFSDPVTFTTNGLAQTSQFADFLQQATRNPLTQGLPWQFSGIFVPGVGIGPAISFVIDTKNRTVCVGLGVGASEGHNANAGPVTSGNPATPGLSISVTLGSQPNAAAGVQVTNPGSQTQNGGPTIGIPGLSVAVTVNGCVQY